MTSTASQFPSFDAYQAALQHPDRCFSPAKLKSGQIEKDLWGFPRVRSGGFALTYQLANEQSFYAVRCFHKESPRRSSRYQKISSYLDKVKLPCFVPVQYLNRGVKVGKDWYPITIMPWIRGDTLENYIYKNLNDSEKLKQLPGKFVHLIELLEKCQIAHGDLSHQNILVMADELFLVDYDGMFVPSLSGEASVEIGHSNFQHPLRSLEHYNSKLDYFSSIVIYLALTAVALTPQLWTRYEASGDGMLFRKKDFLLPYQSVLLQELETYSSLRKWVSIFKKVCVCEFDAIPSLAQFIAMDIDRLPREEIYTHRSQSVQQEVAMDATQKYLLLQKVGKVVHVVGKVKDVFEGKTKDGHPHAYLNVGNWRSKCFTVVLWGEAYDHFLKNGYTFEQVYQGKWISIRGVLTSYRRRLQIALDSPMGVEVLAGEEEAKLRLGMEVLPEEVDIAQPEAQNPKPVQKQPRDFSGLNEFQNRVQAQIDKLYKQ